MKLKIKAIAFILIVMGMASATDILAATKCSQPCRSDEWKQKMLSEKIAFLTAEIDITPEEAQVFWPVYNQVWKEKDEAMEAVFKSGKALEDAVASGKSEKEIARCLDAYLKAQERQRELDTAASERFKAVLPVEKVARLYMAEEHFRRQQIHKLHGKPEGPEGGPRR
ncbi:MAG: hypothetical protein ACI3ZL_01805 [Candidatus Cryptobacteroides sp.]